MKVQLTETGTLTKTAGDIWELLLISSGQGSSGKYSDDTLKLAAEENIFKAGTLGFVDHATEGQDWERPEGSIKDLSHVLLEDARWDESVHGLRAPVKVFSHWLPTLESMRKFIGVSIRAAGEVQETAEGREVTRLTEAKSVDFVTRAGRGGRVLEVLESARPSTLDEIAEIFRPHTPASAPTGEETQVSNQKEAAAMATIQIEEADHTALVTKAGRVEQLEADLAEANKKIETVEAEQAKAARRAEVAEVVEEAFDGTDAGMVKELLIDRLAESDATGDDLTREARTYADDYKTAVSGSGQVRGLGESRPVLAEADDTPLTYDDLVAVKGA